MTLRLGTRGSALAVAQARWVAARLDDEVELVTVTTSGDRGADAGDKARWVRELERALLEHEIDLAVHSAKDVPGELPDGLEIAGVPARADARDVLCGVASLEALAPGARVGTSSLRREALVRAAREDLEIVALRGNVDTRLAKLGRGECDALMIARAGLERLDRLDAAGATLDADTFVPAPGQGTLAIETRVDDARTRAAAAGLTDPDAAATLAAERACVVALGATCHTPVGAHAIVRGRRLSLTCFAGLPDGSWWIRDRLDGAHEAPEALGRAVAERMRAAGSEALLHAAEEAAAT